MKTIRDAVHGDMQFDDAEMAVIDTPPLQRLRGIKQLGASNLVFPSAVHTRFEHSLGTCWLTKRLLAALRRRGTAISEAEERTACLAALLHDVTHVPFGHTFEDERRLFERHDRDPQRLDVFLEQGPLRQALTATGLANEVRSVLVGEGASPFVRQLVTGTVCSDLLDYLKRDARFTGLALDYDDRLFHYFARVGDQLVIRLHKPGGFRRDALSELVHLLQMRYTLTERVYYHHAKVAAGAMISRALELALESGAFHRNELYTLRDDSFLAVLRSRTDRCPGLADVMSDLESRRLFKRVYALGLEGFGRPGLTAAQRDELAKRFHRDLAGRRAFERTLAERLGIPESHVILYCPSAEMALKEADVLVEIGPDQCMPLSALRHPDVLALEENHRGLWKLYVLLRRDDEARYAEAGERCEELLGYANQIEPLRQGRLAFGGAS